MPPRATWKGHLKLSLVSFQVRVYNATTTSSRISLNQLHRGCHQRLRMKMVCPEHGDIDRTEIAKGYEFDKGRYVVIEPEDLERIQLETTRTIEITQFVDRGELQPIWLDAPYWIAPDGPVAEEAFRVIREALARAGKVGIGRFAIAGREQVIALEVEGRGLRMTTLRSGAEVHQPEAYFSDIADGKVDASQLRLAEELIESRTAPLDTSLFRDRYQDALLAVVKAKIDGAAPAIVEESEVPPTLSFMDALRASVAEAPAAAEPRRKVSRKKPPAKSVAKASPQKKVRRKA